MLTSLARAQAAAAQALSILACDDAAQEAMADAHTLPALLAALNATRDADACDAVVRALGNRVCSNGRYAVGTFGAGVSTACVWVFALVCARKRCGGGGRGGNACEWCVPARLYACMHMCVCISTSMRQADKGMSCECGCACAYASGRGGKGRCWRLGEE